MLAFLFVFVALGRLYRDMLKQPETRALLAIAIGVLAVGVLFYTQVEHWSVLNALYFCVVTLATVGYGDITPTTELGRFFTIFYIITGVSIIGGFFAAAGRMIQPRRLRDREKAMAERDQQESDAADAGKEKSMT